MAETQEYSVGRLTSLDALPAPDKTTTTEPDDGLLSDAELEGALAKLGVTSDQPTIPDNPIRERGGILRAFGNAEKKLVAMVGVPGYRNTPKQVGLELADDLSKTDFAPIVNEAMTSAGERTLTRMLQTTHDVPTGMLARLGTDRSVFEGAVRGLKGAEHVSGADLFYKGLSAAGVDAENTDMAWRLRMAKLGLTDDPVLDRYIATASDEDLHKMVNPYGLAGSAAGFLLDLGTDAMNWGTLATSLMKSGGLRASETALLRNAAKTEREAAMKAAMGDFTRATEATYGSNSPLRRRAMGIVQQTSDELEKIRAGYETRLADSKETAQRFATAGERMQAHFNVKRIEPQLAKAEDEYRKASRAYAKATFGKSSLLDNPDRVVARYEQAAADVDRLKDLKYNYEQLRGNFEDPQDYLAGLIAASPDEDLPALAAKEVWGGMLQGEGAYPGTLIERGPNAPIQSAVTASEYAPAGASALAARHENALRLSDEIVHYSSPFTNGRIWNPQQESWDGAVAIAEMDRMARERGMGIALGLDPKSPAINNPALLADIGESLRGAGFPRIWKETVGPELLVDAHNAGTFARIMNDGRFIDSAHTILSPSGLQFQTQQDAAKLALAAAMRRNVNAIRQVNRYGIEIPVGPVEWTSGTGAPKVPSRLILPSGKEMPGTLPTVKVGGVANRDGEILTIGKKMLSRDQVKELRAYEQALREAQLAAATSGRANILSAMEALFGTHAVLNPENPVAQFYKANPRMRALTKHGFQLPTPSILPTRDPFVVFKDTGIAENIFDGTRSLAEGRHYYDTLVDDITKGMTVEDRNRLSKVILGRVDPATFGNVLGPRLADAAERARAAMKEGFDLLGLPPEKEIVNYLPTVLKQNKRMMQAMEAGYVPTELMRDVPVIDRMLRMSDYGTEFASRFAKLRRGTDAEVEMDFRDVARVYFNSVLRAKYIAPAMEEAGQLLRGSILEKPRYGEAIRTQGLADRLGNYAQKKQMLDYFEDLERLIHGEPTRLTGGSELVSGVPTPYGISGNIAASKPFAAAGISADQVTNTAKRWSSYIVSNVYINQLAMMAGSAFKNMTQLILPASEYGPLNFAKNLAGYFAKHDVGEILQNGGIATANGVRKLMDVERRRVRADFREIFDSDSMTGKFAKWINDKVYMGMLQHGENALRGMTWHSVASMASKAGASQYDILRMAERASNETQFIYGTLGRGPLFQSPYTRPFIGILTSYPTKMAGAMARNYRENPTALARYMFMVGGASNAVQRLGIDPADLVPWGWAPDRWMFFFPQVGLAKLYSGVQGLAKHPHDSEEWNKAKRDFLNGVLFSGLLPIPSRFGQQIGQIAGIWGDDELRKPSDITQVLPGLNSLVFDNMEPPPSATFGDDTEKALATIATVMGFGPGANLYAKDMRKTFQAMMDKRDDHRRLAEQQWSNYGSFDPAMADSDEVREALADVTPDQKRNIIERWNESAKTMAARSIDGLSNAEQAQIERQINVMIQDPKQKAQLLDAYRQTRGLQRRMEEQARRREQRQREIGQ